MKKKVLVLLSLALVLSVNLRSQVTIGGLTTPKAGALLDLNSSTPGGLVLSNVDLTDLSVIPANTFVGISTQQDTNQELAGMIVYNTNATTGVGVLVWDGYDWAKPCAPPTPGPITFSKTKICDISDFTAEVTPVLGATSYEWSLPPGLTAANPSNGPKITISGNAGAYPAGSISVQAMNSSCGSPSRFSTEPVAIGAIPDKPTNPTSGVVTGTSFTFGATPAPDCTIDWYTAETGGSLVKTGTTSFSETLSATKTYYAESRNSVTGCASTTRLAVSGVVLRSVADCDRTTLFSYGGSVITPANVKFVNDNLPAYTARNGITLSTPVKIVGRAPKTALAAGAFTLADYRDHQVSSSDPTNDTDDYGSWFTWCMVVTHADVLCPSPWRVPSEDDFVNYSGGTGDNHSIYGRPVATVSEAIDGWLLGGEADGNSTTLQGSSGHYWSSTATIPSYSNRADVYNNFFRPEDNNPRRAGLSLRCVK
ncbi:MAG: hypothetical protein LBP72_04265 [Dysgonamonadaceae bacterium]|jgi:uncharacterized protein (TIGR02145 family)|nr:hypothetical protein [Dysgonamonadaceae bacterium]